MCRSSPSEVRTREPQRRSIDRCTPDPGDPSLPGSLLAQTAIDEDDGVEIRRLDAATAPGAAELFREARRSVVTTAAYLLHRDNAMPERAHPLSLVALDGDLIAGYGSAHLGWEGGTTGAARVWVAVRPEYRNRGLGTELADQVEQHAIDAGATKLGTVVENDPAGAAFAAAQGYREIDSDVVSALSPRRVDRPLRAGYDVVSLNELAGRERDCYELWSAGGAFTDGGTAPTFDEWRRGTLESPLLECDGSFTVLERSGRLVSLSWLLVDAERGQAENDWTTTLPDLRGQGLARLAKLYTIDWAAEHGIREILTASDEDNIAMLELNRSLGYRQLWRRQSFEREL
jgi:GNAT superfamily N-acetyltransferase